MFVWVLAGGRIFVTSIVDNAIYLKTTLHIPGIHLPLVGLWSLENAYPNPAFRIFQPSCRFYLPCVPDSMVSRYYVVYCLSCMLNLPHRDKHHALRRRNLNHSFCHGELQIPGIDLPWAGLQSLENAHPNPAFRIFQLSCRFYSPCVPDSMVSRYYVVYCLSCMLNLPHRDKHHALRRRNLNHSFCHGEYKS
jgi:hypothetical protein